MIRYIIYFSSVTFIIGIICFLLGCNSNIKGECLSYNVIYGTVYSYSFYSSTCSRCLSHNINGGCTSYYFYTCYNSNVNFQYSDNQTCYYSADRGDSSQSDSISAAENYEIGYSRHLLKNKNTSECLLTGAGMDIWISGVAFLSITAFLFIVILLDLIMKKYNNQNWIYGTQVLPFCR